MEGPAIQKRRVFSFAWLTKTTMVETINFLFVILFLYTGISKLMDYSVFKEQMSASPILQPFAPFMAWALPVAEFAVSLMLIIPRWRMKGLYASTFLMIAFTIYVAAIITFDEKLPCSCGGIISLLSWRDHLIFNSAFIVLGFMGVKMERQLRRLTKAGMNLFNAPN